MANKITLQTVTNVDNTLISAINNNNAILTNAINNTLSRDGTVPNQMGATIDMNSNPVINIPFASGPNQPVALGQLGNISTSLPLGFPTLTGDVTGTVNSGTGQVPTTLATVNANVGTFGTANAIPVITENAKGLTTSVTTVQPNPTQVNSVSFPSSPATNTVPVVTGSNTITYQQITSSQITNGTVTNADLANMNASTIKGNNTGISATPIDLTVSQTKTLLNSVPQITTLLSGSGTYNVPANSLWIKVTLVGAGGGGGGSGTTGTGQTAGGTGGTTSFGTSLLTCVGGTGGGLSSSAVAGLGGAGGSATNTGGFTALLYAGNTGGNSGQPTGGPGPFGANTFLGGAGTGGAGNTNAGVSGIANTGSGGGAAAGNSTVSVFAAGGGGAGGQAIAWITAPAASYNYSVGTGGTAGSAGTSGFAGGVGGSGVIFVEAYFQ